ncbi:S8 family serine peptidase [Umezawaea tangerina]|uniref:Subtilase family protein n=1 Tax=Umezawaea tangerina TaxID=84725 RepID=A0A2T0T7A0_9PSEU|nr:S8 family serine peptidase [Umezawaea tangerina]PRY41523.1 subtilase family protein [Umezawaea tangerina]
MRRRLATLGAVAGLLVTLAPAPPTTAAPDGRGSDDQVTLVTGDRVTFSRSGVGIVPARGREHAMFAITTTGRHRYVIPDDAQPLISAGRLDKALFDVDALREFGYADATPVIVEGAGGQFSAAGPQSGVALDALVAGHDKVWLDGKKKLSAQPGVTRIGAPGAWQAGLTGTGVKVAVLDTGVDESHPDLVGRIAATANFSSQPSVDDTVGHGTHVASIIAGSGAGLGGKYTGVAPDAALLIGKVCESTYCQDSAILEGMRWAVDQGADIVNMSLGAPSDSPGTDPIEQAVDALSASSGALFVIAAGNSGPGETTLGSPGSADAALTVGAVDAADAIAPFSSRGPRIADNAIKPDITAPGVDIAAAKAANGTIGTPVADPGYVAMSGTSMATPHVAGAAALLAQRHPDWTGSRLKSALVGSAEPTAGLSVFAQGSGRVDVTRALAQSVDAEPASLSFGVQTWPHDDDVPVVEQVTYRNTGADPVVLDLALEGTAAQGGIAVSPTSLTVPAGGRATATVTADTRGTTEYGKYEGALVATGGGTRVRTPVALTVEDERYRLDVTTLDSQGAPDSSSLSVYRLDQAGTLLDLVTDDEGKGSIRLPKGVYGITGSISTRTEVSLMVYADLDLTADTQVSLDARDAGPVDISLPDDPAAAEQIGTIALRARGSVVGAGLGYEFASFGGFSGGGRSFRVGRAGGAVADGRVTGYIDSHWRSGADGLYTLGWDWPDQVPNGIHKAVTASALELRKTTLPPRPEGGHTYIEPWSAGTRSDHSSTFGPAIDITGVTTLLLHATPGSSGTRWSYTYLDYDKSWQRTHAAWTPFTAFRAGRTTTTSAMTPVLGPTAVSVGDGFDLRRVGDALVPGYPLLYGDAAGNRGAVPMAEPETMTLTDVGTGKPIAAGPNGTYPLPADRTRLRLDVTGARADTAGTSTRVEAAWEFSSAHTDGTAALPLSVVRFTPKLDATGAVPGGGLFALPLQVQQYDDSGAGAIRGITVDVSYDDGKTWAAAPVRGGHALLRHPKGPGHVSLHASAKDSRGNTSQVTVIRAYALSER